MKAKLSMAFADLRGKDGSVVVQKGRSGLKLTPGIRARNPRSAAQTGMRGGMGRSSKLFNGMTPAQAASWNAYGATQTKRNPVNGTTYTMTGINALNALTTKFLQINPAGTVPLTPPTAAFAGDSIAVTCAGGTAQATFTASAANATNVKTELLLQPLKGRNRQPTAKGYRTKRFIAFAAGTLTANVAVPAGFYAPAYRFVNNLTGQELALVPLPVITVS